ncbi:hypothetical protein B0O99DRAFT_680140 [Bisporella sp. PMI_857]|nr:hypothetical protein B0O99DRAFT_680140 [Bisporella sp. PMI_857]
MLAIYQVMSIVCDAVRTRTLVLAGYGSELVYLFAFCLGRRVVILFLESRSKHNGVAQPGAARSPEVRSGILARAMFAWFDPIPDELRGGKLDGQFFKRWRDANDKHKPNAPLISLIATLKWWILSAIVPRAFLVAFTLSRPLMVHRAVDFVTEPVTQVSKNAGYGLIGAYTLVFTGMAVPPDLLHFPSLANVALQISSGIYWHIVNRIMAMVRGNLVALIYAKSLELSAEDMEDAASLTLMSSDVDNAMLGFGDLHEIWTKLVQIGIAMWLLEF